MRLPRVVVCVASISFISACGSHDCASVGYVSGMQIQLPNRQWGLAEFCVDGQCLATEALASGDVMVELGDEPAEYSYRVRVVKPDGTEILREGTAATRPFRGNGAECNPLTANAVLIVNANGDVSVDSP